MTSKRRRSAGPETRTTMFDSTALEFKVDYEQTKHLAAGEAVYSDDFSVGGGLIWRLSWFPRGIDSGGRFRGVSLMVELMTKSQTAEAIVGASLMKPDQFRIKTVIDSFSHPFSGEFPRVGWLRFLEEKDVLEHVIDGHITVFVSIMVLESSSIPIPPSDIGKNLGTLLDTTDGADVSFSVGGETFHAHPAVLAARSPVFRAELLGSMAEATMPSITLHDIAPATFRAMLRFIYTDAFPLAGDDDDDEPGDSPPLLQSQAQEIKHLLAAADRYGLDRLKIMCAQKLLHNVSVDTVCDALACADIYNCPELKSKCIEFVTSDENFKKVVLTESFMQLGLKFPSVIAEVRKRVG